MSKYPYFKFWTESYLADTLHLSDAEHGIYLQLLLLQWQSPGCKLPRDDIWLSRKLRRSPEEFDRDAGEIIEEFFSSDGNYLFQKRLLAEYENAAQFSEQQSARAKSRWDKKKPSSRGNAGPHTSGNASIAIATVIDKEKKGDALVLDFDRFWRVYPRKDDKKASMKEFGFACKRADKEKIILRAESYAASVVGTEKKFIKLPSTWLRNDCWENDYTTKGNSAGFIKYPTAAEMEKQKQDLLASVRNKP